jgi:gliding motility-associated lipoprotein GldD
MRCLFVTVFIACILASCNTNYVPKPTGYLRFDPPEVNYIELNMSELPYKFMISQVASIELPPADSKENWMNIDYPALNAKIYCTCHDITPQTLPEHAEECRKLVSRTVKQASAINEKQYENSTNKVFAILFEIEGETPSPVQFLITDSIHHFFRGALYFQSPSNLDSLAPYTEFISNDVLELIQTFEWN